MREYISIAMNSMKRVTFIALSKHADTKSDICMTVTCVYQI